MNNSTVRTKERSLLGYLFSKTWQYSEGNRHKIVTYWIMFIIANIITMAGGPLIMAKIMDIVQKEGITEGNIWKLSFLLPSLIVVQIAFWGFHGPARLIEIMNAFKAKANYRKSLLRGVFTLPLEWHTDHHSGDTIDRIEKGTGALYSFSESSFMVISSLVKLGVSYAMLVTVSHSAAYLVLGMIIVTVWITMRFDKATLGQYKDLNRAENFISESVYDAISNITTVVILRVESHIFAAIAKTIDKPYQLFHKNRRLIEWKWFLTSICCSVMTVSVLGMYFWNHIGAASGVLASSVYILMKYLDEISELFYTFTSHYGDILKEKANIMNSEELTLDFKPENFTNHVLPENWKVIEVKGLNFSYHRVAEADLNLGDVSFSIKRGERIAFVGKSGGGKTTLLRLIRSLYHPRSVSLTVDGVSVPEGFDGISRAIALIPQSPEIFAKSIGENITLGAEYSDTEVAQCIDMACFKQVLEKLPNGLNTMINEKGVDLSGGQQQRLALARGLLASGDKSLVLLDEPTSSVDALNEMTIYRNIFGIEDKTFISTIHSLELLPLFDRIFMFDGGRIVGSGTLPELLKNCPEFLTLWLSKPEKKIAA